MKIVRWIVVILLGFVNLLVILSLLGPRSFDVSRTTVVEAPPEKVFPYVRSLKKTDMWGPWRDMDPNMRVDFSGEDGQIGSMSRWSGPAIGKGTQVISRIEEYSSVRSIITFHMPWGEAVREGYFALDDVSGNTRVTWGITGRHDFFGRIMALFGSMDSAFGADLEKGLHNLSERVVHDMTRKYNGYDIQEKDFAGGNYVVSRSEVVMDDIGVYVAAMLPRVTYELGRTGTEITGYPATFYFTWDEEARKSSMAAGVPIGEQANKTSFDQLLISEGPAIIVDHFGSYDSIQKAHLAIDTFIMNFDIDVRMPVIEEYISGPETTAEKAQWHARVVYLVRE